MKISHTSSRVAAGVPLEHFWSFCVGAGRANEGLRANWQEQLDSAVQHCGFKYLRFHGLFHDDMCVYRELEDGTPVYNWQYVHDLFDRMLDKGIRPFVELGFCPAEIASVKATCFWWKGNGSPPSDYGKWAALVDSFVRSCIDRYGITEVRSWYFEVWNEPNLHFFFKGTKSQYFELYKVSAQTIKAIDPALRVGGPATSNFVPDERFDGENEDTSKQKTHSTDDIDSLPWRGVWIEDFIAYCHREKLPMDFLSTHPYPTDFAIDHTGKGKSAVRSIHSTQQDLQWLRDMIDRSPYPRAEIHLTEWSSSPSARDHNHDYIQGATFIVKCNVESIGLVDSLSYWTFTDIFEEHRGGDAAFHGGFGLITFQNVAKPAFHAYRMLNALGDELISRFEGGIVTRKSVDQKLVVLAYHYPPEIKTALPLAINKPEVAVAVAETGSPALFELKLDQLAPNTCFAIETLDRDHGSVVEAWHQAGAPHSPSRELTRELQQSAWETEKEVARADENGVLQISKELQPWALVLIREI